MAPGPIDRSTIVGNLRLSQPGPGTGTAPGPDPQAPAVMLIELNAKYPGGLLAATGVFFRLWAAYAAEPVATWPPEANPAAGGSVPDGLAVVAPGLYQCVLSRAAVYDLVRQDRGSGRRPPVIYRVWPDYLLEPHIDRSAATVKANVGWNTFSAFGHGIVWAVIDSGIDATHDHFSALELHSEAQGNPPPEGLTTELHRDFSYLVNPDDLLGAAPAGAVPDPKSSALTDESGHGTHVAGIISGCSPQGRQPRVAESQNADGSYVPRAHVGKLSGMAPSCELVSLKVMRHSRGLWVTSWSAVIKALTYLRTEVNENPDMLRVHGVNMSLGCLWDASHYAAGQSPLCRAVNQLVGTGVIVVISAGNSGANQRTGDAVNEPAPGLVMGSITEPAHAEECIAVGSTHRDEPHMFGVTWTSGKGPTLDGRNKPDIVAPGEWITSAAAGELRAEAGLDPGPDDTGPDSLLTYAEQSGTSMAAPHVSGILAAFLSARREFIGNPRAVKKLLVDNANDLGRDRNAQGAGLANLMKMLENA
jgi:subtilisin family serine protease